MNSEKGLNIFTPKNINSITNIIALEGIEKIKIEKKRRKKSLKNTLSPTL